MGKKPADRRPDQQSTKPGAGGYDPGNPDPRRMSEEPPGRKDFEKPEGRRTDKPLPTPAGARKGKDLFGDERSDRESGRPVQLEDDDDAGRSDRESGRPVELEADEGRFEQRKGRQGQGPREVEPTTR